MRSARPDERRSAFDRLVTAYWKPVFKYVRLKWHATPEDAADLTQGFFLRAFEKDFFAGFDPSKARFRTYLRTCLDGFVANARKADARLKRGGGVTTATWVTGCAPSGAPSGSETRTKRNRATSSMTASAAGIDSSGRCSDSVSWRLPRRPD